jgi:hypothetical protein
MSVYETCLWDIHKHFHLNTRQILRLLSRLPAVELTFAFACFLARSRPTLDASQFAHLGARALSRIHSERKHYYRLDEWHAKPLRWDGVQDVHSWVDQTYDTGPDCPVRHGAWWHFLPHTQSLQHTFSLKYTFSNTHSLEYIIPPRHILLKIFNLVPGNQDSHRIHHGRAAAKGLQPRAAARHMVTNKLCDIIHIYIYFRVAAAATRAKHRVATLLLMGTRFLRGLRQTQLGKNWKIGTKSLSCGSRK